MQKNINKISFILNGKIEEIDFASGKYTPNTTVLQYLRGIPGRKGVKEGCAEGDCGACTIVLCELKNGKLKVICNRLVAQLDHPLSVSIVLLLRKLCYIKVWTLQMKFDGEIYRCLPSLMSFSSCGLGVCSVFQVYFALATT